VTGQLDAVVAIAGASSGIGAASAEALVQSGARVVLGARRRERLDGLVKQLGEDRAVAVQMDVRRPGDSRRLVAAAVEHFGRLSALVANSGVAAFGGILDNTDEEYAELIDVNFAGTIWAVRAAVPALLDNGGGDIVIVASVAGLRGSANDAVYAGTKFGQIGLAGALDRELWQKGIRVSTICPALCNTDMAARKGFREGDPLPEAILQPADVAHAVVTVLGQPRHVRTTLWVMWSMAEPTS
jgi:3-oxoacyl-[acyl-carrier protein] reductase